MVLGHPQFLRFGGVAGLGVQSFRILCLGIKFLAVKFGDEGLGLKVKGLGLGVQGFSAEVWRGV